jgi:hypothetical protein
LYSEEFELEIEFLLQKERPLENYEQKIELIKDLIKQIDLLPNKISMNLFLLDCTNANQVYDYCTVKNIEKKKQF